MEQMIYKLVLFHGVWGAHQNIFLAFTLESVKHMIGFKMKSVVNHKIHRLTCVVAVEEDPAQNPPVLLRQVHHLHQEAVMESGELFYGKTFNRDTVPSKEEVVMQSF